MIVTLRKFLEIASNIICPYLCTVYLEYEDEIWGADSKVLFEELRDMKNLEPYLNYEIFSFKQKYRWGELDSQCIWLREVK